MRAYFFCLKDYKVQLCCIIMSFILVQIKYLVYTRLLVKLLHYFLFS